MYHLGTVKGRTARAIAAAVLGGGGLTAGSAAMLVAGTGPAAAAESPMMLTAPVSYSCDFSSYGQGLAPLTVNATMNAPSAATTGTALTVTLVTSGTAVPAATAAGLPAMSYLSLTGMATLSGGATLDDSLTGRSGYLGAAAGSITEIPSITGTGTVTPQTAGTVSLAAPSSIQLVPSGNSGTMAPVPCTATSAVQVQVAVVASGTGTGTSTGIGGTSTGAQGAGTQMYACATQPGGANGGMPTTSALPMRLTASGPDTMAASDQVSLTSATPGAPMAGATPMAASASLGLAGAAGGSIPLSGGMRGGELALTADWQPTRAGVYRLAAPHRFQVTMRTTTKVTVVLVCTTAAVTTTTTTVHISKAAMPGASAAGISASETTPTGMASAPATGAGGSLHSPVDLALLTAGVVAAAAGLVTMLLAMRRRGRALMP